MATCLQGLPMVWSVPSSSSSSTPLNSQPLKKRSHTLRVNCYGTLGRGRFGKMPMPSLDSNDSFLSRLSSLAAESPESLNQHRGNSNEPPFLNLLGSSPKLEDKPAPPPGASGFSRRNPRFPPPDLASIMFDARIVYIGMPLVSAVAELVFAQLLYLQWRDPNEPIYMYINSTGTTRDSGAKVASEYDAFLVYDAMMNTKNEIHTVVNGCAIGQACLLAAAGKKGKRYMFKQSKVMLQDPKVSGTGLMPASDVLIHVEEAKKNRETLVRLLAKHTGNSEETVSEKMREKYYMDAKKAKEFGVIDEVVYSTTKQKITGEFTPSGKWGKI